MALRMNDAPINRLLRYLNSWYNHEPADTLGQTRDLTTALMADAILFDGEHRDKEVDFYFDLNFYESMKTELNF